ncbi:hypothetical protein FQN53_005620 [Emmonsiellopsis sp. PD_33]|nr:hypothetical protein FQN53_005620 [Emmonsiellopsis sp. PD_33]
MASKHFTKHLGRVHLSPGSINARVPLAYEVHGIKSGEQADPIIFLHGFLGSKRENRSVSSLLAKDLSTQVFALDLRNHGDSGHHPKHGYMEMALDVEAFIKGHGFKTASVIGHSMGAKTALALALHSPELVSSVVAVDNCPIRLPVPDEFKKYLTALAAVERSKIRTHLEGDKILAEYEESPTIRLWLLSNFVRDKKLPHLKLRLPLDILRTAIGPIGDFPYSTEDEPKKVFHGPTLFIRAQDSFYIPHSAFPVISSFFPHSQIKNVACGHWVVQELPQQFRQMVVDFLRTEV